MKAATYIQERRKRTKRELQLFLDWVQFCAEKQRTCVPVLIDSYGGAMLRARDMKEAQ